MQSVLDVAIIPALGRRSREGELVMSAQNWIPIASNVLSDHGVQSGAGYTGVERRHDLRVELPFSAVVRGVDGTGDRFEEEVVLESLSARGLYVRLRRPMAIGTTLFICVKLWLSDDADVRGPQVAVLGTVVRAEGQPDNRCGIAVTFDRHRFLYVAAS